MTTVEKKKPVDTDKTKDNEHVMHLDAEVGDGGVSNVARIRLKKLINDTLVEKGISVSSFSKRNGVARQYMYRILSFDENVASTDRLLNYAASLGYELTIVADSSGVDYFDEDE